MWSQVAAYNILISKHNYAFSEYNNVILVGREEIMMIVMTSSSLLMWSLNTLDPDMTHELKCLHSGTKLF